MKEISEHSSVFIEDYSSLENWKSCAFFWGNMHVYESFIQDLATNYKKDEEMQEMAELFFENNILKIVMRGGDNLKNNLWDKVYAGMDDDFYHFLYKNADRISVSSTLPENHESIIKKAAESEYSDEFLCKLMDSTYYNSKEEQIIEEIKASNDGLDAEIFQKYFPNEYDDFIKKQIDVYSSWYKKLDKKSKYHFEWCNESLLIKNSVSSSILTSKHELPYYNYKFDSFKDTDANRYIRAINASMPLLDRNSIDELSFDEIIRIRNKKSWKNAMNQLCNICNNVKYTECLDEYEKEIMSGLTANYQDSLDEYRLSTKDIIKSVAKDVILAGVSFVPLAGTALGLCNTLDSIVSVIKEKDNQKNLAFFLNDIKNNRY